MRFDAVQVSAMFSPGVLAQHTDVRQRGEVVRCFVASSLSS